MPLFLFSPLQKDCARFFSNQDVKQHFHRMVFQRDEQSRSCWSSCWCFSLLQLQWLRPVNIQLAIIQPHSTSLLCQGAALCLMQPPLCLRCPEYQCIVLHCRGAARPVRTRTHTHCAHTGVFPFVLLMTNAGPELELNHVCRPHHIMTVIIM